MVVLLVVITFAAFLIYDALVEKRRRARQLREGYSLHERMISSEPQWVAGYNLPQALHYHQGHTWAHWVGPEIAYVGIDDFGRRFLGKSEPVSPPPLGTWVSQGKAAVKIGRGDREISLLSPLSGEIIGVNPELERNPAAVQTDSYGRGWLYKIKAPEIFEELNNLMSGTLASRWMQDVQRRFQHQLMLSSGSVIQDGGTTVDDLAARMDPKLWRELVDEFLLQDTARMN